MFQSPGGGSPPTQVASSVLTSWRGAAGLSAPCGSVLAESLRTRVGSEFQSHWGHLWVVDPPGVNVGFGGELSPGVNGCSAVGGAQRCILKFMIPTHFVQPGDLHR